MGGGDSRGRGTDLWVAEVELRRGPGGAAARGLVVPREHGRPARLKQGVDLVDAEPARTSRSSSPGRTSTGLLDEQHWSGTADAQQGLLHSLLASVICFAQLHAHALTSVHAHMRVGPGSGAAAQPKSAELLEIHNIATDAGA